MIAFEGTTNKDYLMVNTAKFRYPNGREVTIDRNETYYTIENGKLSMEWRACYFWDENGAVFLTDKDYDELENAELIELELEEDADADYVVEINNWAV